MIKQLYKITDLIKKYKILWNYSYWDITSHSMLYSSISNINEYSKLIKYINNKTNMYPWLQRRLRARSDFRQMSSVERANDQFVCICINVFINIEVDFAAAVIWKVYMNVLP